jgi:hypothetical protein
MAPQREPHQHPFGGIIIVVVADLQHATMMFILRSLTSCFTAKYSQRYWVGWS